MSRSSKILEGATIIAKTAQVLCDSVPILTAFKPIAVIVVKICETAQVSSFYMDLISVVLLNFL